MRKFLVLFAAVALSAQAAQADTTCQAKAAEKKLAGAALTSFMTKCEKDASASCEKTSADKKLAGAAKSAFEKKCVSDAIGKKS